MTIPDEEHDRLYRTEREQSATIARLERQLADARQLAPSDELCRNQSLDFQGIKADADALRALAAWMARSSCREVVFMGCLIGQFTVTVNTEHPSEFEGTGATLAAAIMDALKKAG